jgi:hypothetical protein
VVGEVTDENYGQEVKRREDAIHLCIIPISWNITDILGEFDLSKIT